MPRKDLKEPRFPNLRKMEELEAEEHATAGVEAGLTVDQAIRHAKDDVRHWSPRNVEEQPHDE